MCAHACVRACVCVCVRVCVCFVVIVHWHCSAQLSMFNMEKRYRNKIIIIIKCSFVSSGSHYSTESIDKDTLFQLGGVCGSLMLTANYAAVSQRVLTRALVQPHFVLR